jgi:hypothetical protein
MVSPQWLFWAVKASVPAPALVRMLAAVRGAGTTGDDAADFRVDRGRAVIDLDDPGESPEGKVLLPIEHGVGGVMTEDEHPAGTDEIGGGPVDGRVAELHRAVGTEGGEATRAEPSDLVGSGADGAVGEISRPQTEHAAAGEFQIAAWQRGGVLQTQQSIVHRGGAVVGVGIGEREHAGAGLVQAAGRRGEIRKHTAQDGIHRRLAILHPHGPLGSGEIDAISEINRVRGRRMSEDQAVAVAEDHGEPGQRARAIVESHLAVRAEGGEATAARATGVWIPVQLTGSGAELAGEIPGDEPEHAAFEEKRAFPGSHGVVDAAGKAVGMVQPQQSVFQRGGAGVAVRR